MSNRLLLNLTKEPVVLLAGSFDREYVEQDARTGKLERMIAEGVISHGEEDTRHADGDAACRA
jgi:hypothetical protein